MVTPQNFQIGLEDDDFKRTLVVQGIIKATDKITAPVLSGSLTTLEDGTALLRAGNNVTITSGSADGDWITIAAGTGALVGTLSGQEAYGIQDFSYDGSGNVEVKVDLYDNGGITFSSSGLGLNPNDVSVELTSVATDDVLFIYDTSSPTARNVKKVQVSNLLAGGTAGTLTNALTAGSGLQISGGDNTVYDNSAAVTILIATASAGGLEVSSDALGIKLDGSTLSLGASGISVASVPGTLTIGSNLTLDSGTTFDGSAARTLTLDTSTVPLLTSANAFSGATTFTDEVLFSTGPNVGLSGSLQEVSSGVPYLVAGSNVSLIYNTPAAGQITIAATGMNALSQGSGIAAFSYDGTSTATVALDATNLSTSGGRSSFAWLSDGGTTITKYTVASLIDQVDRTAIMNAGTGIDITFAGNNNPATIATKLDGTTLGTDGSGNIEVSKVPNALSQGIGIKTFSYDGSATKTIAILDSIVATLSGSQFSGNVGVTGSLGVEGTSTFSVAQFKSNVGLTGSLSVESGALFKSGLTGSLQTLPDGSAFLRAGNDIQITSGSEGWITISSTAGGGVAGGGNSDKRAKYLVLEATASLAQERVFTAGIGVRTTDGGNGGAYTVGVKDSVFAALTGSTFSGDLVAQSGLSGSLQMLSDGSTRYLIGTGAVNISTSSAGQIVVSSSIGRTYTASTGLKLASDVFSIDNTKVATLTGSQFSGNVGVTGSLEVEGNGLFRTGLSGSLQMLSDGSTPYIIGAGGVKITTSSSGQLTVSASAGSSSAVTQAGGSTVNNVSTFVFTGSTVTDNSGGSVTILPVIGAAEDTSYSDGLFTDFVYSTPIGTAIDRFNEVLKGLAPQAAPALDDMSCADSGTAAVLSFGSTQSISGYTNVQPSTLTPTDNLSDVNINGTFSSTASSNDLRKACFAGTTTINGTLNADVAADGSNYSADSFGNGNQGTLKLFVNNNSTEIHSVDLSSFGSGNSLNGNGSGFNLSAATPGHFSDGTNFDTFQHRQGTYTIDPTDQRTGWNYARVVHTISGTDTTCNYVEWVNDTDSNALSADTTALEVLTMTGTKNLSGVKYNTGGTARYRIRVLNAYRNVYSTSNITFNGTNCSVPAQSFPVIDYGAGESETKTLHITGSATITGDPILNGSISVSTDVPAPLKSNLSSAGSQSISGILLYNLSDTSTTTSETFRGESYRIISGSYDVQANVTAGGNTWDSTTSLAGVDGLMFYNSRLYAPVQGGVSGDFRSTANGGSIANGPSSNVNYSGITSGQRTFYRYFQNTSGGSKSGFSLTVNGSGTIASLPTSLSTANLHVLIKLPTTGASFETGWMDLAVAFATGQTSDGDGCLEGSLDSSLNATNTVTFGTESVGSNEYVVVKIEADASWTGYISSMSVSWS